MTPQAALIDLLERLGANCGAEVFLSDVELSQWPSAAVKAMKSQKLIVRARPSSSTVCPGCEQECVMPVHTLPASIGSPASFIVCDSRSDTNRVPVSREHLTQWKCEADAVCGFVAASRGLRRSGKKNGSDGLWDIGLATGDKRSQMLCLQAKGELSLVVGNSKLPLVELLEYRDGEYSIDGVMVCQLVDAATTADERYTPTEIKREARKLKTQAMHEEWRKAYRHLKKNNPDMTDTRCAQKISKMDISQGRTAGTIHRQMKK